MTGKTHNTYASCSASSAFLPVRMYILTYLGFRLFPTVGIGRVPIAELRTEFPSMENWKVEELVYGGRSERQCTYTFLISTGTELVIFVQE